MRGSSVARGLWWLSLQSDCKTPIESARNVISFAFRYLHLSVSRRNRRRWLRVSLSTIISLLSVRSISATALIVASIATGSLDVISAVVCSAYLIVSSTSTIHISTATARSRRWSLHIPACRVRLRIRASGLSISTSANRTRTKASTTIIAL